MPCRLTNSPVLRASAASEAGAHRPLRVWAVVPAFRAGRTIARVVENALAQVDTVVIVDDACPEGTGDVVAAAFVGDERVQVIRQPRNTGVGGATKTGFAHAMDSGADVVIKLDADDQMDSAYIPFMVELLENYPYLALVKGNRFGSTAVLRRMPLPRLIGNSGLSFLVKLTSGYWNVIDPTNGYIACRTDALRDLDIARLADRYFFEIDLLCALGLRRAAIAELEMEPIYAGEHSSLSVVRTLLSFPAPLFARFVRRLFVQYVLADINVATLYAALGVPLFLGGAVFGAVQWQLSAATAIPRTSGTVVLALLLFIVGFQLVLQAIAFDVADSARTLKARVVRGVLDRYGEHEPHAVVVGSDAS
jgi:dolichol-phosphate mannosyltransferase